MVSAHHCANVARTYALHSFAGHSLESVEFLDALTHHRTIFLAQANIHTLAEGATVHTAHCYTANVRTVVERSDKQLRIALEYFRLRDIFYDCIEQRSDVVGRMFPRSTHPVLFGRTV